MLDGTSNLTARSRRMRKAAATGLTVSATLLLLAGCVGGVHLGAALFGLLLLGAASRLQAQAAPLQRAKLNQVELQSFDPTIVERLALSIDCIPQSYQACVDGQVVTERACCPVGVVCNYGQIGVKLCNDGSCVSGLEECPDCIPQTYQTCENGQVVSHEACCPIGVACNYGQIGIKTCPDGSCVTAFERCPPVIKHPCIPQRYRVCEDGAVVTKQACCPVGVACNFGQIGVKICADGFCVSGLESCPEDERECQPQSFTVCEDGKVVTKQACCPPGVICNFGQIGVKLCKDGSCVPGTQSCGDNVKLQSLAP